MKRFLLRFVALLALLVVLLTATAAWYFWPEKDTPPDRWDDSWSEAQRVTIKDYADDAMEPFLTRDNRFLLFNNRNAKPHNTNLHWAERLDDLTFQYRGEIANANTEALEGVPTLDAGGTLYFVSPRSYEQTLSTLHQARWHEGTVSDVRLVAGLSLRQRRQVQFDAEITPDGNTLYAVNSHFGFLGPTSSDFFLAHRQADGTWKADPRPDIIFRHINTPDHLEYAAGISADALTLYFNRVLTPLSPFSNTGIWIATRASPDDAFSPPRRIRACEGFVEGATMTPDNQAIYYHKREGDRFVIYRTQRK